MPPRAEQPERYQPLPGLLEIPGWLVRKLSHRGRVVAGVAGVIVLVGAVVGLAIGIPAIIDAKRASDAAEQRARDRAHAERIAKLRAEVRLVDGHGTPSRGLHGAAALGARHELTGNLAGAIQADARSRARTGEFAYAPERTECERYPRSPTGEDPADNLSQRTARYACLAVTTEFQRTEGNDAGIVGYPYRALVHFPSGRFTFCKVSGQPGEGLLLSAPEVPVPPACGGN